MVSQTHFAKTLQEYRCPCAANCQKTDDEVMVGNEKLDVQKFCHLSSMLYARDGGGDTCCKCVCHEILPQALLTNCHLRLSTEGWLYSSLRNAKANRDVDQEL